MIRIVKRMTVVLAVANLCLVTITGCSHTPPPPAMPGPVTTAERIKQIQDNPEIPQAAKQRMISQLQP
jgi:hypothetical protein